MKTAFQIKIDEISKKIFFPEERIKDKFKILEILLEACRYIIYNKKESNVKNGDRLIFNNDKMRRLFFVSKNKIYSIAFPFNIYYSESETRIDYKNRFNLDSYTISNLLSLIKAPTINSESCLDFADPIVDLEQNQNLNYWMMLRDLLLLEDGYIRYDKDEDGYKEALSKKQQHKHPLNHIDIFYTSQVSFKLGLEQDYVDVDIIDTLDVNTNCRYLKIAENKENAKSKRN